MDVSLLLAPILGAILGLIPGVHPLLFHWSSDAVAAIVYAFYTVFSLLPTVTVGAFVAGLAFSFVAAHRLAVRRGLLHSVALLLVGVVSGAVLSMIFYPLRFLLAIRPPRFAVFAVLIVTAALLVLRSNRPALAALVGALSGALGLLVLRAGDVVPLVSGLFGVSTAVLALVASRRRIPVGKFPDFDWYLVLRGAVFGFLAGLLVSVFPAMSVSVAALFVSLVLPLCADEMVVAAGSATSSSLVLSLYSRSAGIQRTALAAAVRGSSIALVGIFAASVLFASLLFAYVLRRLVPLYTSRVLPLLGVVVPFAVVGLRFGFTGLAVLVSSAVVGALPHLLGVEKSLLMYSLIVPTLLYYAPV